MSSIHPNGAASAANTEIYTVEGEKKDSILANLMEVWKFRALVVELVMRELKIRYKNRVGGILWSLATPVLQVLTITLMVKLFLSKIDNYSAYLMGVMFLWQFFQNTILDSGTCILANSQLARKIYFPRAILPIVAMLVNLLHFCISLAFTLAYLFVLRTYPEQLSWSVLLIFPVTLLVGLLGLGVGFLTARLNTLYEDVKFLSQTFMGLFFYGLPILYPIEKVAMHNKIFVAYMLNPMASFLVAFQRGLLPPPVVKDGDLILPPVDIPWLYLIIATVVSLFLLGLGYYTFERSKWIMMERL